jgi:hypothetical protein
VTEFAEKSSDVLARHAEIDQHGIEPLGLRVSHRHPRATETEHDRAGRQKIFDKHLDGVVVIVDDEYSMSAPHGDASESVRGPGAADP